ncbi:Sapep family Mn(2+)-dependent dipeptidase [Spiroplasma endosymbiont of Amphibalanus improvisus]|uniref:Sapep family Mn(2+)-dependent dipeptidase n=1 Tax=Spiroplasma endosymbiont of Amphibalanus improvisus TaxID=3066327 RepID=UPI00313C609A
MEIKQELFNKYREEAIKDLINIMKIRSVAGGSKITPEAPFGVEVKKVLDYALNLAEKMGFKVKYGKNNKYGYAEFGEGEQIMGIICHLDVVPPGDLSKWVKSPWDPIIENDEVFGRGALDDKGPTIMNMYALKYLKDQGWTPKKYKVRIIFGLTEETTWESIKSYIENEQIPDFSYTPDGEWPLIYSEKRIVNFDIVGPGIKSIEVTGEGAYNVVNDICTLTTKKDCNCVSTIINNIANEFETNNWEYSKNEKSLISKGKAAHGSTPELGVNAAINLARAVHKHKKGTKIALMDYIQHHFAENAHTMPKVFTDWEDDSGVVSINVGKLYVNANETRVCLDGRMPASYSEKDITDAIEKELKLNWPDLKLEVTDWEDPVYIDPKSEMAVKLLKIYQDVTKDYESKPLAIGGGTYARGIKNCIAFGAVSSMELMHNVNERISIKELENMLKIYIKAIYELA